MKLQIKNAWVFDPANGINGELMDIFIDGSKIVEECSPEKIIDAQKMLTLPGGIDIHSHIAGAKINFGRLFRPEDSRFGFRDPIATWDLKRFRSRTGISVPNVFNTGYLYAEMGYTTVIEPAIPPIYARHTHDELYDTPMIHKAALTIADNNWVSLRCIKDGDLDALTSFLAWLLRATKGYGIKLVNPGGDEAWGFGKNLLDIDEQVPEFQVTPREIILWLGNSNENLRLPHSIHVHTNALGIPGNYQVCIKTLDLASKISGSNQRQKMHIAHIQFSSYGGESWKDFCSASEQVSKALQRNPATADLGCVVFGDVTPLGDTTTMTADGPLEYGLHRINHRKWINRDVELETGAGLVPYNYSRKLKVNCVQWAVGLEIALMVDPWKLVLSTDHPNGGPFQCYPWLLSFLMSSDYRNKFIKEELPDLGGRIILESLDREYDLYQMCIITRAAPAKILGLRSKGRLDPGSDADIAIYPITQELDPSKSPVEFQKLISRARYTICSGSILVAESKLLAHEYGSTLVVNPEYRNNSRADQLISEMFQKYYSVNLGNYPVQECYLRNQVVVS